MNICMAYLFVLGKKIKYGVEKLASKLQWQLQS